MNGDDFIQLAGKLATSVDPVVVRSTVSRAYWITRPASLRRQVSEA